MLEMIMGKAMATIRRWGFMAFISLLLLTSTVTYAGPGVAILQYHHIGDDTPRVTSVTAAELQQHFAFLEREQFNVISLSDAAALLADPDAQARRSERFAAITIDDGWANVYTQGLPLFKRYQWPVTIFVNPQLMREAPHLYMSWAQLRELTQYGVVVANHSQSHPHMTRRLADESEPQWAARMRQEILAAQAEIDAQMGAPQPKLFAYPYGEYNPALAQLLQAEGFLAFAQHSGSWGPYSPLTAIPRFPASAQYADLRTLRVKLLSLPLPVTSAQPLSMMLQYEERRPTVTVSLAAVADFRPAQMNCFYGTQVVQPTWQGNRFSVTLPTDAPIGRSRLNCTVPSISQAGRFYWYSHPLLRPNADGSWPE